MKLYQIAALLCAGIVVGIAFPGRLTNIFGNLALVVFLPALIFEAAWNLDAHLLRRNWKPIVLLAVPGVVITAAIVAAGVHAFGALTWPSALLLGTVLSATDPVAVIAVFRKLPIPPALATIVQSEALMNDAVAVVLYRAILAAVMLSAQPGAIAVVSVQALLGVLAAVCTGVVLAMLVALALRTRVEPLIQVVATFAGAYAGYILCERLGWSGIFAVLAFGIALREYERRRISVQAASEVSGVWDRAAVFANAVLFFLIGTALDFTQLRSVVPVVAVTIATVVVARAALSYGLLWLARASLRANWASVVRMAGIRGALSLALALAIPQAVPQRAIVIDATFAVVVVTILIGTLTLPHRISRIPLGGA